jgi:hypothetical protein
VRFSCCGEAKAHGRPRLSARNHAHAGANSTGARPHD